MRHACGGSWRKGKRGKGWKGKIEIVAGIKGRKRVLVAWTEAIAKTEWPAHDSTDAPRLEGVGKREAREEMEREDRNSGGDRRKDGFGG